METWQRNYIIKNLPQLMDLTEINSNIRAELLAKKVLCKEDLEILEAMLCRTGNSGASSHCYNLLMGRTDAYRVLTRALVKNHQTGAAKILIDGAAIQHPSKPLTFLGIPMESEDFQNVDIEVYGKTFQLHEFFPIEKHKTLQRIFQDTLSEMEFYHTFVTKQRTFVLSNNTIPPKSAFYIPRFLSNRIKLEESTIKADCPDVFVFKKSIERYKLSQIAKPYLTAQSSTQRSHITSRFIYLDNDEDWIDLKTSAKVPIHLISYEANQKIYILQDTTAAPDILTKASSQKDRPYISEEDFVRQQVFEEPTPSCVCICDTPGMGKTLLLANIARSMTEICTGRIIAYIPLTTFPTEFSPLPSNIPTHESALLNVFRYISSSKENAELLHQLVKAELLLVEIFFDGFDEIPSEKADQMKKLFLSITNEFPVRIYITSRPHMRKELETSLGVLAYDIMPFDQNNQVDFLVKIWSNNEPNCDVVPLKSHAKSCLEAINGSLTTNDKEITGIPLLCQLLAEVAKYSNQRSRRKERRNVPLQISKLYQKFIEQRINAVTKKKEEFDGIKLAHIWHALKLLFPTDNFHQENQFKNVKFLTKTSVILEVGIIQQHPNETLEFIHRTFAEYFVAAHFATKLQIKDISSTGGNNSRIISILTLLLHCNSKESSTFFFWTKKIRILDYFFLHSVIVSFVDFTLGELNISEDLKSQVATFFASTSPHEFLSILCACCQQNFYHLFCLLKEGLIKCDSNMIQEHLFTTNNNSELLSVCIRRSTSQMLHNCIQLFNEILDPQLTPITTLDKKIILLRLAVKFVNYEAVEYFVLHYEVPLKGHKILELCVHNSYYHDSDITKKENILKLLLNEDPSLIHETPKILVGFRIHLRLIKVLVQFGAKLTVGAYGRNCVTFAAEYMSADVYHDLVKFILAYCKDEYLCYENEKWIDLLSTLIREFKILPKTLELLLNNLGIDINKKDKHGENLLFAAVDGEKLDHLQDLVNRGLDFKSRGMNKRSLLHDAAYEGCLDMVKYLLSLGLDPNSRDIDNETPLHKAVNWNERLPVLNILLEYGADVQAKNLKGQTALHLCSKQTLHPYGPVNKQSNEEIIKCLISKGLDINACDIDGNTPLHLCKAVNVKNYLVAMGADVHAKNDDGQTPAQINSALWQTS